MAGFWNPAVAARSKLCWWPDVTDKNYFAPLQYRSPTGHLKTPLSSFNSLRWEVLPVISQIEGSAKEGKIEKEHIAIERKQWTKLKRKSTDNYEEEKAKLQLEFQSNPTVRRGRLIEMIVTEQQRKTLLTWFRDTRKTYNLTLAYILQHRLHQNPSLSYENLDGLPERDKCYGITDLEILMVKEFVSEKGRENIAPRAKMSRTPKVPRQQAVKRACEVLKTYSTNYKFREAMKVKYPHAKRFKKEYRIRPTFKSRQLQEDTIYFDANDGSTKFVDGHHFELCPRKKLGVFVTEDTLQDRYFQSQVGIHYRFGKFFLMISEARAIEGKPQLSNAHKTCAIDPGIRDFLTVFSPEGRVDVLGASCKKQLNKLHRRIDRKRWKLVEFQKSYCEPLVSVTDSTTKRKIKAKRRRKLARHKARYHDAERKACNVVKDLHYKASHFLCQNYKQIIYPYFSAKDIAASTTLHASVKRRLNTMSFFKFAERLKQTMTFYPGVSLIRGTESFTSKQCGKCGTLREDLSSEEVFSCHACHVSCLRDVHAARNILLRHSK
jgi:transposase